MVNGATEIKFYDYILLILRVYPDFLFFLEGCKMEETMSLNIVGTFTFACKQKETLFPLSSTLMNLPHSFFKFVCLLMTGFNRDRVPDLFAWMR